MNGVIEKWRSEGWFPISEISLSLGIPAQTIYTWVRAKKLGTRIFGVRRYFLSFKAVQKFARGGQASPKKKKK